MDTSIKRIIAYIIDFLLLNLVLLPIINLKVINPYLNQYNEYSEQYQDLIESSKEDASIVNTAEYKEKFMNLTFQLNKNSVVTNVISMVGMLLYFGVIQYFWNGQTVGKKILKLKVVSNNEKDKLNIGNFILRSFILYGILYTLLLTVFVYVLSVKNYYYFSMIIGYMQLLTIAVISIMVLLRKDNRGLHDLLSKTKVITQIDNVENK